MTTTLFITAENGFTDSMNRHVITNHGVTIDSSTYAVGKASLNFAAASHQYMTIPISPDFYIPAATDWTIDFWLKTPCDELRYWIVEGGSGDGTTRWIVTTANTTGLRFNRGADTIVLDAPGVLVPNTWQHVAVTRATDNSWQMYVDGVLVDTGTSTINIVPIGSTLCIGCWNNGQAYFLNGNLDNLRITQGERLWTSNFELTDDGLNYPCLYQNCNREDNVSKLYHIGSRGNLRGKAKQGWIRPTIKQFFTSKDWEPRTPAYTPTYVFKGRYSTDRCIGGSVSEAGNYTTGGPNGAFDGSLATTVTNSWYFQQYPANGSWIQYQFTSAVKIEKMRLYSWGGGSGWEYWTSLVLSGSNDGTNYTEITSFNNSSSAAGWTEYTFDNPNTYTYYKMFCTFSTGNLGGGAHIGEIEMLEKIYQLEDWPEGYCTEDLCVGGVASASSVVNASWPAANAFDNGTAPYSAWQTVSAGVPAWITYDFGEGNAKKIIQLTLTSYSNTNPIYYNAMPTYFIVQGSNDNTNWTNLDEFATSWSTYSETQVFSFLNSSYYRYYRLYITTTNTTYCVIGEIQMMEAV